MPIEITNDFLGYHAKDGNRQIISIQIFEVTTLDNNNSEKTVCRIESIERYGAASEQETEAVQLIFGAIAEEYDDEPYIPGDLDGEEKEVLSPLFTKGLISKNQLLDPEFENYSHDLSQKKVRESLASSATTQRVANQTRTGYFPRKSTIITRHPRNYKSERSEQILRHMATQLYNFCKANDHNPTEVQIMYLGGSLVIATNNESVTRFLDGNINTNNMKNILTTTFKKHKGIETEISARFAAKLQNRIYGEYIFASKRDKIIKSLLQNVNKLEIDMNKLKELKFIPGSIYFVTNSKIAAHAEMHLLKVLECFYFDADDSNGGPVIYGKKRPCFTCHSTLQAQNEEGLDFVYNPRRGLFFLGEFKVQEESVAESTTHELVYSGNVYESYPERSGYCTLSDSEEESEEILVVSKSISTKLNIG